MKKKIISGLFIIGIIIGILIMLYPSIAQWYNTKVSSYIVDTYYETSIIDPEVIEESFSKAIEYNESLAEGSFSLVNGKSESQLYSDALNVLDGMIGVIRIESINLELPFYHGTSEEIMQSGIGHLEGSSLPTGNVGEHTLLTGHRGIVNAKLFTDLDQVEIGDYIELDVYDQTFTYCVTDIFVVLPDEIEYLEPVEDKELLTLITCTPYGVNTHRLLVQATRIEIDETIEDTVEIEEESTSLFTFLKSENNMIYSFSSIAIILILIFIFTITIAILKRKKR